MSMLLGEGKSQETCVMQFMEESLLYNYEYTNANQQIYSH